MSDYYLSLVKKHDWARNSFIDFVLKNLDKRWDWSRLSGNNNIYLDQILANKELPWDWREVCYYHKVTIEDIRAHPDVAWDWEKLSYNEGISIRDRQESGLFPEGDFCYCLYPKCDDDLEYILENIDCNWFWVRMFNRSYLTIDFLVKFHGHCDRLMAEDGTLDGGGFKVIWFYFSESKFITLEDILANLDLPWDWYHVSQNPNVNFQHYLDHPELPWDILGLSRNKNLRLEDVISNPDLNWDWTAIVSQKWVNIDVVIANPSLSWSYFYLPMNDNITFRDMLAHRELPWGWINFSFKDYVSLEDYIAYRGSEYYDPGDDYRFCASLVITFDYVKEHPEMPWNYELLSSNNMPMYRRVLGEVSCLIRAHRRMHEGGAWDSCLRSEIVSCAWGRPAWIAYQVAAANDDRDDVYGQYDLEVSEILAKN